jgi:outer membrane protein assembly factor BamB
MKNKFNASVFWRGHFYGLDEGVLACVNAETGERLWRDGRYGYGQVLLASGHLIILGGEGQLALVEASPRGFREKRVVSALSGKTWNEPTLAHGRLLVRNAVEMACYDLRPPAAGPARH